MSTYHELDYIDPLLLEEEILIRNTIREYVDKDIISQIGEYFSSGQFPMDMIKKLATLGILGGNLPLETYIPNFMKISDTAYGLVMEELERADSGLRSFASVTGALTMFPILEYGSEDQKEKWLNKLYTGEAIGCFGLTEEQGGSDPSNMQTRAKKSGDGYILNGRKAWITNGEIADISVVWALDEDNHVKGFLVEKNIHGFSTVPMVKHAYKNSMRASVTSYLILEDCYIDKSSILPNVEGSKSYLRCLSKARYGIAWGVIGSAYGCFHEIRDYLDTRILFNEPLSHKQLIQNELSSIRRDIEIMQGSMLTMGRLADQGLLNYREISLVKFNNVTTALQIALRADELLGANRISNEYNIPRHLANLRSVESYEGTRFIHSLIQGADITGYKAF